MAGKAKETVMGVKDAAVGGKLQSCCADGMLGLRVQVSKHNDELGNVGFVGLNPMGDPVLVVVFDDGHIDYFACADCSAVCSE